MTTTKNPIFFNKKIILTLFFILMIIILPCASATVELYKYNSVSNYNNAVSNGYDQRVSFTNGNLGSYVGCDVIGNGQFLSSVQFTLLTNNGYIANNGIITVQLFNGSGASPDSMVLLDTSISSYNFNQTNLDSIYSTYEFNFNPIGGIPTNDSDFLNVNATYFVDVVALTPLGYNGVTASSAADIDVACYNPELGYSYFSSISYTGNLLDHSYLPYYLSCLVCNIYTDNGLSDYSGCLNGGIFNNYQIAYAPIQITLQQGISYSYTGNIYINSVLNGNGNFTVSTSGLNPSDTIFTNGIVLNPSINGTINNGVFQFNIAPTLSTKTIYEVMEVSFILDDHVSGNYIYNLGFYAIGGSGSNGVVPYPTPPSGSGSGGSGGGSGSGGSGGVSSITSILTSIFGNVKTDIIFIIFGVICALLTWRFAMTGLIAGVGISTFLCVMAGILPIWAVGLCVVLDVTLIVLGSGLLNKNENKGVS
jgi:hypothetical protein